MIIYGWRTKLVKDLFIGIRLCKSCRKYSEFYMARAVFQITIFFIPIFWWTKKYYVMCNCCDVGYPVSKVEYKNLKELYSKLPSKQRMLECYQYIKDISRGMTLSPENVLSVYEKTVMVYRIEDYEQEYKKLISDILTYGISN